MEREGDGRSKEQEEEVGDDRREPLGRRSEKQAEQLEEEDDLAFFPS